MSAQEGVAPCSLLRCPRVWCNDRNERSAHRSERPVGTKHPIPNANQGVMLCGVIVTRRWPHAPTDIAASVAEMVGSPVTDVTRPPGAAHRVPARAREPGRSTDSPRSTPHGRSRREGFYPGRALNLSDIRGGCSQLTHNADCGQVATDVPPTELQTRISLKSQRIWVGERGTKERMEITKGDMDQLCILMDQLSAISASCDGRLESLEIRVTLDGQRFVIGYGESGEPAILHGEDDA